MDAEHAALGQRPASYWRRATSGAKPRLTPHSGHVPFDLIFTLYKHGVGDQGLDIFFLFYHACDVRGTARSTQKNTSRTYTSHCRRAEQDTAEREQTHRTERQQIHTERGSTAAAAKFPDGTSPALIAPHITAPRPVEAGRVALGEVGGLYQFADSPRVIMFSSEIAENPKRR